MLFLGPKADKIKGFGGFIPPQNSRIFSFLQDGLEYAQNAIFPVFQTLRIHLSHLLGFNILDLKIQIYTEIRILKGFNLLILTFKINKQNQTF